MEELQELLNTSLTGRMQGIETFNQFTEDKKSLLFKLYSNIRAKKINTDAEAREMLYGKNYSGKSYDMLKKRFKEKLYTNVLFIQPREKNTLSYAHNAYFVHKHYIVGKVLLMAAARKAGRIVLGKVLKRAQTYEITEIAMLTTLRLKREASIIGDRALHQKYASLFEYYMEVLKEETETENKFEDLIMHFAKSYRARPDLIPQAKQAFAYIEKQKNAYGTFILHQTSFQAYALYSQLCGNYKATLKACNTFEQFLKDKPQFYSPVRHANIIITKLNCYLHLGLNKEGLQLAQESLKMYDSAEGNRLIMQELHFLLAMRAQDYILAANIFTATSTLQKRKNIDQRQKEMWRIYNGYLVFCLASEKKSPVNTSQHENTKSFSINKLLNEVPIYTKDKQSINLSLNILQLCFLLQRGEFEKAIDKTEKLKIYIYKHIDRNEGAREHAFLKLILLLQKHNFNAKLLQEKSAYLVKKLSKTTNAYNPVTNNRIEVLVYEKLWKRMLEMLFSNQ